MALARRSLVLLLLTIVLLGHASYNEAAKKSRKRAKPRRKILQMTGPTDTPLWELGLNSQDLLYGDMLEKAQQFWSNTSVRMYPNAVLGYVTPWNKGGYETSETFKAKFTHVSPVWYQLKYKGEQFVIQGGHDVNTTWVRELQKPYADGTPGVKVLPRIIFELEPSEHVQLLVKGQEVVEMLIKECDMHGYDGLTLETWMQWQLINGLEDEKFRASAVSFVRFLASELQQTGRQMVLVVVPALPGHFKAPRFEVEHFKALVDRVDYFSVMTYDWQGPEPRSNANAPLRWLMQNLELLLPEEEDKAKWGHKILLGLNFYGYDYSGQGAKEAVTGKDVIKLLDKHGPELQWHKEHFEHFFEYEGLRGKRVVFYPTPASIQFRLKLAQEWNVGLSVWELGQGLPWFMDLL